MYQPHFRNLLSFHASAIAAAALVAGELVPISTAQAWTLKTLYSFCAESNCTDGQDPSSDLVSDGSGDLYGTTEFGGDQNVGTIFELIFDPGSDTYKFKRLYSFCPEGGCADGQGPAGKLIRDVNGNLYGTTQSGGNASNSGTVYELRPNTDGSKWKLKVLHTFCSKTGCTDGDEPHPLSGMTYQGAASGVPYDGISPVYGTTILGGARDKGVVFQLTPVLGKSKWSEKVIYSFCSKMDCSDGWLPNRSLIVDPAGNLYGALGESDSRTLDDGVLFELSPTDKRHWKETVLHAFCQEQNCADGQLPGTPVMDSLGNLFGTTQNGGPNDRGEGGAGIAFKLAPNGSNSKFKILYDFCSETGCNDGKIPVAGLMVDSSGTLYGTTVLGGPNGGPGGTVFRLTANGKHKVLFAFCAQQNCVDGDRPRSGVIMNVAGHLFGDTQGGGANGNAGTVFELTP